MKRNQRKESVHGSTLAKALKFFSCDEKVSIDLNWLLDAFNQIKKVDVKVVFEAVCRESDVWDSVGYHSPLHHPPDRLVYKGLVNCNDLLMMLVYLNRSPSEIYRKYQRRLAKFTALLGHHLRTLFRQHNCYTTLIDIYTQLQEASEPMTERVMVLDMIRRLASAKESVQQTATILLGLQKRGNPLFGLIGRDVTKYISRNVKYSYWDEIKTELRKEYEQRCRLMKE
jgi:hypothetical protein